MKEMHYQDKNQIVLEISVYISLPVKVPSNENREGISKNHCNNCGEWLEGGNICGECGEVK